MSQFFTRERFGGPQAVAGLLLLLFLGQCVWLAHLPLRGAGELQPEEQQHILQGLRQWRGEGIAGTPFPDARAASGDESAAWGSPHPEEYDAARSPMYYLITSAPLLAWPAPLSAETLPSWGWLARAPFLLFGVLLGASLWYVARRLYGNPGGYIALTLYCFSPAMIRNSAAWFTTPETGAAWGAFGAIFTAIAVSHTLYAPREVVLWNWRRILLLGMSLALAIGSQFSLVVTVPITLAFLLYLAPGRRGAALAIWAAGCAIAWALIYAAYFFHPGAFWEGMSHARFLGLTGKGFGMAAAYRQMFAQVGQSSPALVLALPAAWLTFAAWRRARYFGNTAPLAVAALFSLLGMATPHYPGLGFQLMAAPFWFVFVAGVFADLLETRRGGLVLACVWGLLGAYAVWSVRALARV